MRENKVNAILAKYGVKHTGTGGAEALPAPVSMEGSGPAEQKNAILVKYGVKPGREAEILNQAEKKTAATAVPLPIHTSPAQGRALLGFREPVRLPEKKTPVPLPVPKGQSEAETLRQESRIRSQLSRGVSPERLGAQAAMRQQRIQDIPADELKKRHEQAVGHLNEVQAAIADRERKFAPYATGRDTVPGGIPYAAGAAAGERSVEDKALQKELAKWQGIVDELAGQYYYRENEEKAAALTGDRTGQEKVRAVEDILADLRTLGEVATGQGGNQKDREALMKKYDLDQRELEVQATALMGQLQGELERAKAEAGEAGYNYDRMKKYQDRQEQVQRAIEGQKHTAEFAEKHPVRSSAASILISPVQGLDYFSQLAGGYGHSDTKKLESYVPANAYEMRATNFVRNVRGTVARELEEKHSLNIEGQNVASFLYQTGMSMGDFLFNAMLAGNFSGGLGGAGTEAAQKAASNLSLAIMGSGAAANTTAEAIERGLDNRKAYTLGAIAGVAEIITEKVSLETLLDRTALDRSAMGYLLKNMAAEGSEEVASDLINWAADVLVAKDRSEWQQAIDEYRGQGMGEKEAFQMALKDQLISMAWSGAGGALSGGVMAGGSVAIDNAVDSYRNRWMMPEGEAQQVQKTAHEERAEVREVGWRADTIISEENMTRYRNAIDGVFTGHLPSGSDILVGETPAILQKNGVPGLMLHMTQNVARKIAYPMGYFGGKHNLGMSVLKNLPYELADPVAIINNPQVNPKGLDSKIVLTEWTDPDGLPIIIPIHIGAQGAIEIQNDIATAFGARYIENMLGKDGENIIYTKNNEDIHQLLSNGRRMPEAMADDVLAKNMIPQTGEEVKGEFTPERGGYSEQQGPVLLPVAERQVPKPLPVAGKSMLTEEDWSSLMGSDTGLGARREATAAKTQTEGENPFIQTGTGGEFVDDRTDREKAMVEEAMRRKAAQPKDAEPVYRMTPAMEKLGMEVPSRPITDAGMSESLRAGSKAHYEAKRALDKVLRDTHADERARRVARGIVDGVYTFADADRMGLDRRAMADIVEAMELERSFNGKNIKAHQERTNWAFDGRVQQLIRDAGSWKTPSLVSMNANTMQRTVERMADPATAKAINEEFFEPVLENEAKRIRFVNDQLDRVRGYHLTAEESGIVQKLMEGKVTAGELQGKGYDVPRLEKAAGTMAEMYSGFYDAINDFLVAHGYEEIGWQKNYAPHMQEENLTTLQKYLQRLGFAVEVTELPTEIAGRTDAYKPGKQYSPFFQHRTGGEGDIRYDAVGGLESYINYMSNVLYHTDDIQKLRRLSEGIRGKFAEGHLREELDRLNDLQEQIVAGEDVRESWEGVQARKDKLYEELDKKTKLGGFVSVLDDYTNILAGKQSKLDRAVESFAGRKMLNWGRNIQNAFARSAVMGNLSSAINQTVQLPQLTAEVGSKYVLQAINDVAGGKLEDFSRESAFLTGKQGIRTVSALEGMEILYDKLSIPFEAVDDVASRIIVRAKYLQQVEQGMGHAEALKAADQYANRLVGSRMKGAKPIVFEQKNPITKLVTTFQLEVANSWEHIVHDLPMELQETARTQGKAAAVGKTVKLFVGAELAAFVMNLLIRSITGREPVPFDGLGMLANYMASGYGMTKEEYMRAFLTGGERPEKFDVPAALGEAGSGILDNIPYASNITTLLGVTDGRLPLPQIETKKLGGAVKDAWTAVQSDDEEERKAAGERVLPQAAEGVLGTAASFLPAGNQIKKTVKALPVLGRGGAYTGYGDNEKLRYPVEQSPANWAKGLMFGTSALPETDAYYAEGKRNLTVKETGLYEDLVKAGSDGQKIYDAMQELKGARVQPGKVDVLLSYDGTQEEKEALFSGMVTGTMDEELEKLNASGIPFDAVLKAYRAQYGIKGDKDPGTGETVPLSASRKKKDAVDQVTGGLNRQQREVLYSAMEISEKVWDGPKLPPVRK